MRTNSVAPINILRLLDKDKCPYCEQSNDSFYDEGKDKEESDKLRKEGKVKPLWFCSLEPSMKGQVPCTNSDWKRCPLYR